MTDQKSEAEIIRELTDEIEKITESKLTECSCGCGCDGAGHAENPCKCAPDCACGCNA